MKYEWKLNTLKAPHEEAFRYIPSCINRISLQ